MSLGALYGGAPNAAGVSMTVGRDTHFKPNPSEAVFYLPSCLFITVFLSLPVFHCIYKIAQCKQDTVHTHIYIYTYITSITMQERTSCVQPEKRTKSYITNIKSIHRPRTCVSWTNPACYMLYDLMIPSLHAVFNVRLGLFSTSQDTSNFKLLSGSGCQHWAGKLQLYVFL